jgi:hypothetical protein
MVRGILIVVMGKGVIIIMYQLVIIINSNYQKKSMPSIHKIKQL